MYIITYTYNVKGEHMDVFFVQETLEDCVKTLQEVKDMWGKDLREWYIAKVLDGGFVNEGSGWL